MLVNSLRDRERFITLVNAGVQPEVDDRERGMYKIHSRGEEASVTHRFGANAVRFFRYDTTRPSGIKGIGNLGFLPTHGVQIDIPDSLSSAWRTIGMFGLREDQALARSLHEPDMMGLSFTHGREIDPEETAALLYYLTSPLTAAHCLATALRKTPEEAEALDRMHQQAAEASAKLAKDLAKLEAMHRRPLPEIWIH
ncbi:hypothetical protein IPM09_01245 [Candidatus Saccharibacteria bacterium]|nr:MAG: hypothetical protein IPM09_01245 [Candidatus Saccharibacteria bacterium]